MNLKLIFITFVTLFTQVHSEIDAYGAISDGFITRAISKPIVDYTKDAITDKYFEHYICTKREAMLPREIIANKSICYPDQEVISYILLVPGSTFVLFIFIVFQVIFAIAFIFWCFTSSIEEKLEFLTYVCLHLIGQIIYEMFFGDDDD